MPAVPLSDFLSIYDIAEQLGCSPPGVHKAIDRLGIEPAETTRSGYRYFKPSVVDILRKKMRLQPTT
jgi:hypothetical protein